MARLELSSEVGRGGVYIIKAVGKLDVFSFAEFKQYLEELGSNDKSLKVVVDLKGIQFVASSGWSVLLSRRARLKEAGGDLLVCSMSPEMLRVYDSMRIQKLLPSSATAEEAVMQLCGAGAR